MIKKLLVLTFTSVILCACQSDQSQYFLSVSDVHLDHRTKASSYGKDSGTTLWSESQNKIANVIKSKKVKFMLYLGDLPAHKQTLDDKIIDNKTVLNDLAVLAIQNHIPLLYVPGNNENLGGNYHSFTDEKGKTPLMADPNHHWPLINGELNCNQNKGKPCVFDNSNINQGYYSAYPQGTEHHLFIIVLNSVIFSPNYVSDGKMTQLQTVQKQLDWLHGQLQHAKQHNDQVFIAMHIPPGLSSAEQNNNMWSNSITVNNTTIQNAFLDIIQPYHSSITALLTAHTHFDEIRKIYNKQNKFNIVGISTPSISPQHKNNPGFKLWQYNPDNNHLIDFTTYYRTPQQNVWHTLNFKTIFQCGKKTIFSCIKSLNTDQLHKHVKQSYTLNHNTFDKIKGAWERVFNTIDVKYQ
jgi:sphingomyelin phosphodiesterase acid-like 3